MTVSTNDFASPGDVVDAKTGEIISTAKQRGDEDSYGRPALLREHGGDGRPYIQPADGSPARWYTRSSTLAKALEKTQALERWKLRTAAQGLAARRDLMQLIQADPSDTKRVDESVDAAIEAARGGAAANTGTAIHRMTEFVDQGQWPVGIDSDTERMLLAYQAAMQRHKVQMLAAEIFVANDELGVAGTFDRLVFMPHISDKPMIADLKTGKHEPRFGHYVSLQLATYAHGQVYTPTSDKTGTRGLDLEKSVDQEQAIVIHLPASGRDQFTCDLYLVDIAAGWKWAKTAVAVRDWHKTKPMEKIEEGGS